MIRNKYTLWHNEDIVSYFVSGDSLIRYLNINKIRYHLLSNNIISFNDPRYWVEQDGKRVIQVQHD